MDFSDFSVVNFAPINRDTPGFVYILFLVHGSQEVPFYVGQTKRIWGRLDDYYWAMFSARTDFHVGEAIKHFGANGYRVVVKYRSSEHPIEDERKIIKQLEGESWKLMNQWTGLDFKTTSEAEARTRVHKFLNEIKARVSVQADPEQAEVGTCP